VKFLFLRGQVPQDRDPKEIVFNTIKAVDDVWTQLIYAMTKPEDETELWYWNGDRTHKFSENFTERWIPDFRNYVGDFVPDVIICRGGFSQYHRVLKRFPHATKVYYGAGRRFLPQPGFEDYDLILQDSREQEMICKEAYPKATTTTFIKPAPDNMFYPIPGTKKEFDVVFPANGRQEAFKGHEFVYRTRPKNLSILNLGNKGRLPAPKNITRRRVLRSGMARELQRAKVGIVACKGSIDSCPRVIPEMLACGIPIVCLDETRFWKEKYINDKTGIISSKKDFWKNVNYVLENLNKFDPSGYYTNELSLKVAAQFLRDRISEVRVKKPYKKSQNTRFTIDESCDFSL
jgi:hypothetical protein